MYVSELIRTTEWRSDRPRKPWVLKNRRCFLTPGRARFLGKRPSDGLGVVSDPRASGPSVTGRLKTNRRFPHVSRSVSGDGQPLTGYMWSCGRWSWKKPRDAVSFEPEIRHRNVRRSTAVTKRSRALVVLELDSMWTYEIYGGLRYGVIGWETTLKNGRNRVEKTTLKTLCRHVLPLSRCDDGYSCC